MKHRYKQTEFGTFPAEWETHALSRITERISVGLATSVTKYYRRSGVPIVRNLNIKDGFFDCTDMLFVSPEFAKANAKKAARAFDVLTVRTGSNLGQTCVLPTEFDNCQTFTTLMTTANKKIVDPYFLCLHMSSEFGRNEMARLQAGGAKGNLNTSELKKYRIALPSQIAEQQAIVAALSDVDALLGGLDRLIAKKRDLKQAAMQQLLTGRTRLPGFDDEWAAKRIADIAQPKSERNAGGESLPVLTCSKHLGFVDSLQFFRSQVFSKDLSTYKLIRRGEIGYPANHVEEGSIGLQDLYDTAVVSPIYVVFATNAGVNSFFLQRLLKLDTYRQKFKAATAASVDRRGSLRWPAFSQTIVHLPPHPDEQNAIAAVLSDMETELAALQARRDKTRALKQGMMQELLTGRTRLA